MDFENDIWIWQQSTELLRKVRLLPTRPCGTGTVYPEIYDMLAATPFEVGAPKSDNGRQETAFTRELKPKGKMKIRQLIRIGIANPGGK